MNRSWIRAAGGPSRLGAVLAAGAALAATPAAAVEPGPDSRLRVVDYQPTRVIALTAFVGYHVHLEFAPDERFASLGAGDTASLDVGAEGNHLLLKPRQASAGTNLTILTNRRAYFFDFRALARPPRAEEAVYSIRFHYPQDSAPAAPVSDAGDARLRTPRAAANRAYWFCGSPALRPTTASDDGIQLRLTFAPHAELPAVYAAAGDGAETLVNTHVESDTLVVHRLATRFVLRRGREVGCVVDRSDRSEARRAVSGTVDDAVERSTVVVQP